MSIGLTITVHSEEVDAKLREFNSGLTSRTPMNESVGKRAGELTRNYLVNIAETRHATAQRLGAAPTGHWAQAAEKTTNEADETGATVTINQPGIGRVAHDVTIVPGGGRKYLTIPAIAAAYGKRAATVPDLAVLIRWKEGQRRAIALIQAEGKSGAGTVWYWLVKSVFQPQDRSLLPSDEQYRLAALQGVRDYVDRLLGE